MPCGCSKCCKSSTTTKVKPFNEDLEDLEGGPLEDRECRDVIFLLIFILFFGGMGYVAYHGISRGDPYRLVYGVDSWGNVCNRQNEKIPGIDLSGMNMIGKMRTFYLDQTYYAAQIPNNPLPSLSQEQSIVLCVSMCPNESLVLPGDVNSYMSTHGVGLCRYNVTSYVLDRQVCVGPLPVLKHTSVFFRCIPDSIVTTVQSMAGSFTSVLSGLTGGSLTQKIISDLRNGWKEILYLASIAFASSLIVVIMMGLLAAVLIWTLVFVVITLASAATGYSWYSWYSLNAEFQKVPENQKTSAAEEKVRTWLIYAAIASCVTCILMLVLLIMRKRIQLVVQLFREAGKAIKSIPFLLIQPLWTIIILSLAVVALAVVAVYIETSGLPVINNASLTVTYVQEGMWQYVRWYHLFGMIWLSALIVACQEFVIASAIATWYFKRDKKSLGCPILVSIGRLIRYHLGSIAFGSFIIALVRMARLVLAYVQNKLKGKTGPVVDFILKALQCCLWCFEKFLAYLNRNAYIEIAIFGYGFCKAAQKAFLIIVANALRVAAINSIGDLVLFMGKLSTVAIVMVVGNEFFKDRSDINFMWTPITVACAFAFAISHCFLLVYEITIDTIFLCFCEDCERNDGQTKPYYMSTDLMKCMNNSNKMLTKKKKSNDKEDQDLSTV